LLKATPPQGRVAFSCPKENRMKPAMASHAALNLTMNVLIVAALWD
jgi:hypothetical protein